MPQGRALIGAPPGQQQRPGRAFTEAGCEQRRAAHFVLDDPGDLIGINPDQQIGARWFGVHISDAGDDAVIGDHQIRLDTEAFPKPVPQQHRQRRQYRTAQTVHHADPPVTQFVAEPLHDDGVGVRNRPGRQLLIGQVAPQVGRGPLIQAGASGHGRQRCLRLSDQPSGHLADGLAQLARTAHAIAVPERQPPGHPGRRTHQHLVGVDLLDPPTGGAESEDVADSRLVHHLLVQLADPAPTSAVIATDQEDTEQPAIRNRPATGGDQLPRTRPGRQQTGALIARQPRP